MNPSPRWPLAVVGVCAAIVIAALAWATSSVLRLEARELRSRSDAAFEESVRLALWRIDSALTPLIARESGRPYDRYESAPLVEDLSRAAFERAAEQCPAPTLPPDGSGPFVLLRFQSSTPPVPEFDGKNASKADTADAIPGRLNDEQRKADGGSELVQHLEQSPREASVLGDGKAERASRAVIDADVPQPSAVGQRSERATAGGAGRAQRSSQNVGLGMSDSNSPSVDNDFAAREQAFRRALNPALRITGSSPAVPSVSGSAEANAARPLPPGMPSSTESQYRMSPTIARGGVKAKNGSPTGIAPSESESTSDRGPFDDRKPSSNVASGSYSPESANQPGPARTPHADAPTSGEYKPYQSPGKRERSETERGQGGGDPRAVEAGPVPTSLDALKKVREGGPEPDAARSGTDEADLRRSGDKAAPGVTAPPSSIPGPAVGNPTEFGMAGIGGEVGRAVSDVSKLDAEKDVLRTDVRAADESPVVGEFTPRWLTTANGSEPQLYFVRSVKSGSTLFMQGCWFDWPALRESLVADVADLLPAAKLVPIIEPMGSGSSPWASSGGLARRLATIPARLDPGPAPRVVVPTWSPMRSALALTWVAVLTALAGLAALVRSARDLAERRGRFVSAVSHELRTPLTTFVMYSQMLADGIVRDESVRVKYLTTLRGEALRLSGIVENVLEYARLGRPKTARHVAPELISDLLADAVPELARRCERAGLRLVVMNDTTPTGRVRIDGTALGRVLFNLVDNACKYAASSASSQADSGRGPEIKLAVTAGRSTALFRVSDSGPGIAHEDRGRLFKPFQRGRDADHANKPGLGLGLSLAREIARHAGGDVTLEHTSELGSTFLLTIPLVPSCDPASEEPAR